MVVHLIYPHNKINKSPDSIGWKLAEYLSKNNTVLVYDYDYWGKITPNPEDVLIGHSHPICLSIFRRSIEEGEWKKKILLHPFNTCWDQNSYLSNIINKVDCFAAISGPYWFDILDKSEMASWLPKMTRLDMAIDRNSYPRIKENFNPKKKRKFLYIGNDHRGKNVDFLNDIAKAVPSTEFAWAGTGKKRSNLVHLGVVDFLSKEGRALASRYDFMITVGSGDANPTTILEAISFGLVPVCTVTSGYKDIPGIITISSELKSAIETIEYLQILNDSELYALQEMGVATLNLNHGWDRFCKTIESLIFSVKDNVDVQTAHTKNIQLPYKKIYFFGTWLRNNLMYLAKKIFQTKSQGINYGLLQNNK